MAGETATLGWLSVLLIIAVIGGITLAAYIVHAFAAAVIKLWAQGRGTAKTSKGNSNGKRNDIG